MALTLGHRGEHGGSRRHPLGELFQQLLEVLRITGEEVAEFRHELAETRIQLLSRLVLLDHLVEAIESLPQPVTLFWAHVLDGTSSLVQVRLNDLLAEALHQLLETLSRLARGEFVGREAPHLACEVLREEAELHLTVRYDLVGHLFATRVA